MERVTSRESDATTAAIDVLLVDDEESNRGSVGEILRRAGFSVIEADSGIAALSLLRSRRIKVVLLDLEMPLLDGLSVLDMIDDPPPVLLLTARALDAEIRGRMSKIAGYLQKPFSASSMLAMVSQHVQAGGG